MDFNYDRLVDICNQSVTYVRQRSQTMQPTQLEIDIAMFAIDLIGLAFELAINLVAGG